MASEYINEHELALMLSIGRNCKSFGEPARECTSESREIFDTAYSDYKKYMAVFKGNKQNAQVQESFKRALEVSPYVEPTDKEIARVYELILLLARRCLRTFGRSSPLREDELGSLVFERWVRYRENFDPLKSSEISGSRVNAFAYLTQVTKNCIYGEYNKNRRELQEEVSLDVAHVAQGVHEVQDNSELQELEYCRQLLLKESLRCVEFSSCLLNIARKYEISPHIIIKAIIFFDLKPQIEANILNNKWDF